MSIDTPNNTSALRHRPIEQAAVAPQEGVPLRARATAQQPWRPDEQGAIDLPQRGTRTWVGDDRPAGTGPTRGTRAWNTLNVQRAPAQADVAVEEEGEEEVAAVAPARRQRPAGQPAPKTQKYIEVEEEQEPAVETGRLVDEEEALPEEEPVAIAYSPRRRPVRAVAPVSRRTESRPPGSVARVRTTEQPAAKKDQSRQRRWLWRAGVGALILFLLYVLFTLVFIWGQDRYNDLAYGTTRTFHLDAVVGDHDSAAHPTHFVAMNLAGHIEIVEFPGGDATHARVYVGPQLLWSSAEKAVVSLHLKDAHHTGRPDLEVDIGGEPALFQNTPTFSYLLLNTPDGFKSQQAA